MGIRLRLLNLPNNLKKGLTLFVFLSALVLVTMTRCAEARIAFTSGSVRNSDIYVMTIEGKNIQQLTDREQDDSGPNGCGYLQTTRSYVLRERENKWIIHV